MDGPKLMTIQAVPLLDISRTNQQVRDEILVAMAAVYDSGKFLYGPQVAQFEGMVARLSQVRHAVGCASGSDALLLALMALDVGPGDEVVVPSFTFFATASAVARLGAKIVFADIDPRTYNICSHDLATKINSRTRAIIPVHLFGQSASMPEICGIAGDWDIPVIEDAAQAIGAAYHGRPVGSWGQIGCLSFYPTKNLGGCGDGGMMVLSSDTLADRLRLLAGHGMRPRYHHREIGINSRLDTLQAAALAIKFRHLESYTNERQRIAATYNQLLSETRLIDSGAVQLPLHDPAAYHVWNQYSLRIGEGRRDALRDYLGQQQIGSEIYYPIPLHEQECFRRLGYSPSDLPHTHQASLEILHLPIYPGLTQAEQVVVVQGIVGFYQSACHRLAA
ncbi:MAG: DegT/DnrJ/EryC1/StrS family aminotransferase [Pirellulaceae bacterium]|nr:DegT/DnrJ/EryC1/StrS family aminotransferase [Pirellulaceae bacterium]